MFTPNEKPPAADKAIAQSATDSDNDATATPKSEEVYAGSGGKDTIWAAGASGALYEPIPEYEGRHRYDPTAVWTEKEEKKLVRRLDYRICSWVCIMFFALQLDRGNISQALAELPSQMISKKLGPDVWIPIQMVSWSIVAACQSILVGEKGFYATRALLGLLEGGFIPDAILYFYTSSYLTQIIAAFLAVGIFQLRGVGGWEGWRWMFAIEGGLTALIGVFSYLYMPPSPTQTASWFRGRKGWFTEREEVVMVNRILRDDPSKGGMHNRQGLTLPLLWASLTDVDLWPIYLMGFTVLMPLRPVMAYFTLTLRNLGFTTLQTNLLTVPAFAIFIFQLIFWSRVSERINNRFLIVSFCSVWLFPMFMALAFLPADVSAWSKYAVLALIIGYPYVHSILVGLTSRNAGSVRTRTVGSAVYNMTVQTSSIIGSNIYRADDAPLYRRGNRAIIGIIAWNFASAFLVKGYYMWRNKKRDQAWNALGAAEKDHYLATTTDEGSRRLDFRFAH
ncbi:major facilitator superfamily domain-containing protein [Verticillium dahliae]|nr:major facilitator superfamily domain-containing protein [Verticillium dahliae]